MYVIFEVMEIPAWNGFGYPVEIHSQKTDFLSIDNSSENEVRINLDWLENKAFDSKDFQNDAD